MWVTKKLPTHIRRESFLILKGNGLGYLDYYLFKVMKLNLGFAKRWIPQELFPPVWVRDSVFIFPYSTSCYNNNGPSLNNGVNLQVKLLF